MSDTLDLARLEKLLAEAAPGPWFAPEDQAVCTKASIADGGNVVCLEPERVMAASLARWPENRTLIVAMHAALPHLLKHISELESVLRPFARAERIHFVCGPGPVQMVLTYAENAAETATLTALDNARHVLGEKA